MWKILLLLLSLETTALDQKDVEYARPAGHAVLLDLHVPDGAGPFPAAILVHGGGFDEGSKSTNVRPLFAVLADAGFAWFSIDYRMAPEFHFVEANEDVESAIRWVKTNAKAYRVDPSRIALIGESAGGLLVNYAGTHESRATRVAAVVIFMGQWIMASWRNKGATIPELFNMKTINRHAANGGGIHFFGVEQLDQSGLAKLHAISPIAAVHKGIPPFLCIHGDKDDQVSYSQSQEMCEAMRNVGATCDLITIEGGGHGMSSWKEPGMQQWKVEMVAWLKRTLKSKLPDQIADQLNAIIWS